MRDLTKGSIIRLMLLFSLPILLGSLFQQAYNLVDIIIVGKKLGELSLSAVGSTTAYWQKHRRSVSESSVRSWKTSSRL